jgi:signal transduction histidine kinase/ActR/RegA family two-component response regulator
MGQPVEILVPTQFRAGHPEHRLDFFAEPHARPMGAGRDLFGLRKDGTEFPVEIGLNPIETEEGTWVLSAIVDITERKQAQEERAQLLAREQAARTEAERANRLKDEFLATVSHELRTPLAAVLGWAQLLQTASLDESTRERAIRVIEHNSKIQAKLIEDMLDVSRVVSGKLLLDLHPVQLPAIIDAAIETIRPAAESKSIRIEKAIDHAAGAVHGDSQRLQQVVWNLLSNAVKFTPEGGCVEVRLARRGSQVEIRVSDTGEGIPVEFLPHVFDAFRQADGSSSRKHGGLGLGLAIVRHVLDLHRGTVHVHSDGPGTGATFTIRLPRLASDLSHEESAPESLRDTVPALSRLRVLVVEDDADTRHFLKVLLESHGAGVSAVASAKEALDLLVLSRPDVILCDIGLPGECGHALLRQVRALGAEKGGDIPAVALTADARPEDRQQALAAGYQMHLSKPIDPSLLIRSIKHLVRSTSAVLSRAEATPSCKPS